MLSNHEAMDKWRDYYEEEKSQRGPRRIFPSMRDYMVSKVHEMDDLELGGHDVLHFPPCTKDVRTLVQGPQRIVTSQMAMSSKGRHFRIQELDDKKLVTQDCGVTGQFTQDSRNSRHDQNTIRAMVSHYGKIQEILTVAYDGHSQFEETIFKCKWFKSNLVGANRTVVEDECGFTRLKTTKSSRVASNWQTSEPFAYPHHLEQCFYLPYPPSPEEWSIVMTYIPHSRSVVQEEANVIVVQDVDTNHYGE